MKIGITLGDPAGIGPEIVAQALESPALDRSVEYRIVGDRDSGAVPGEPTPDSSRSAMAALEEAVDLAARREVDAIVTGPVCKHRMQEIGFAFPGQTEFFAARTHTDNFAMLLTGGRLTVALATAHIPLASVAHALTPAEILRVGCLLAEFLSLRLGRAPRIAVAGLNPHAGEAGALGREEIDRIAPATAELSRLAPCRATFEGPVPPDTLFHRAVDGEWDGVLCMYHDLHRSPRSAEQTVVGQAS